ncbi:hypothetical protein ACN6KS_06385 [Paenibacillus nitricinens]|uniref:hypothetical protein n=1 Tax=Paenibacillus nitricinens TaxID=3367691 RepID=UPI003F82E256
MAIQNTAGNKNIQSNTLFFADRRNAQRQILDPFKRPDKLCSERQVSSAASSGSLQVLPSHATGYPRLRSKKSPMERQVFFLLVAWAFSGWWRFVAKLLLYWPSRYKAV